MVAPSFKQKNVVAAYSPLFVAQSDIATAIDSALMTSVLPLPRDNRPLPTRRVTREETRECRGRWLIGRRLTSRLALWTLRMDATAQLVAGILALAQGAAAIPTGTDEVQTLTITATGGTYQLRVTVGTDTQTTTALATGANAAAIQAALEALSNVSVGDLIVTGTGPFVITAAGNLADLDIPPIVVLPASLTGGSASIAQTTAGVGRIHEITHTASDDVPKTSFLIGTDDPDDDEPTELYKAMAVNRVRVSAEVRGKVQLEVDFVGSSLVEVVDPFTFPVCANYQYVYANDCGVIINALDRTADLRTFNYEYRQNLAIADDPFPFDAIDIARLERGQAGEDSSFGFALYGTKAHPVYVAAEAETTQAVTLRIGKTADDHTSIIAAGAQLALSDTPIGYAGEASRSVINVDAIPFSVGGNAPDRVTATLAQAERFLVAPS